MKIEKIMFLLRWTVCVRMAYERIGRMAYERFARQESPTFQTYRHQKYFILGIQDAAPHANLRVGERGQLVWLRSQGRRSGAWVGLCCLEGNAYFLASLLGL